MVLFLRSALRTSLVACLLMLCLMETLTVDARSHHVSRRDANADGTVVKAKSGNNGLEDYANDDDLAYGEFLNDGDADGDDDDGLDDGDDDDEGEEEAQEPSVVNSKSTNFTVALGNTVWLPCDVTNGQNAVIMWKKADQTLFQSELRVTQDSRIFMYTNYTISISDLRESDMGAYTCTVLSQGPHTTLTHVVRAPQPARVVRVLPEARARHVPAGRPLKVECKVTGDPKPLITWTRKGHSLTKDDVEFGDQFIQIKSVTKHDSGMYQCLANNGIGQPSVGAVDIRVLHAPEVHLKKSVVNTDEGYEAQMLCTIVAEPRATTVWERNGKVLNNTHHHHIVLDRNGDHSTLRILKVTPEDFGKYECKANNEYGHGEGHVTLVRHPGRALWISGSQEQQDSSPVLQWAVESVQPITDAELRYYKVDERQPEREAEEEDWIIVKPDIAQPTGNTYTLKHALRGLRPGKYAAQLRARNSHGWSDMSEQHTFDGDYETNEVLANASYREAPVAEVGSSSSTITFSVATLLMSFITLHLVRNG